MISIRAEEREKYLLALFFFFGLFFSGTAWATPEYAARTGRACSVCHIDPAGGGRLTVRGESFRDRLIREGLYKPVGPVLRAIRLVVLYIHMLTAILWFGTILYVHLLLKPAYAARGLPKGELLLGWSSIAVLAVTGTFLAFLKIASWHALFHTRFGILLSVKVVLFLVMVTTAALVTFVIGPRLNRRRGKTPQCGRKDETELVLTPDELARFNGREGEPAYIVYKGRIYDVTRSGLWKGGRHMGKHPSGFDLTGWLAQAPHGEEKVLSMPCIGRLTESGSKPEGSPAVQVFYLFAYTNLVLVFLIVLVIALWNE